MLKVAGWSAQVTNPVPKMAAGARALGKHTRAPSARVHPVAVAAARAIAVITFDTSDDNNNPYSVSHHSFPIGPANRASSSVVQCCTRSTTAEQQGISQHCCPYRFNGLYMICVYILLRMPQNNQNR